MRRTPYPNAGAILQTLLLLLAVSVQNAAADNGEPTDDFPEAVNEGTVTEAGQSLQDRILGRSLIDYGLRSRAPEAIVSGVQILARNPVRSAQGNEEESDRAEKGRLSDYLQRARDMAPADAILAELITRAEERLEERPRGMAGGPKRWVVKIDKGKYYEIDPRLSYNVQEMAVVHAFASPSATLGIRVRRSDLRNDVARSVARERVTATWNSGIFSKGWLVRIYNLAGPDELEVVVETN